MKSLYTVMSAGLLASASISANAFDIVVPLDDFSTDQAIITDLNAADGTAVTDSGLDLGGGITRTLMVNKVAESSTDDSLGTRGSIGLGEYNLSNDSQGTRGDGSVTWDFATPLDLGFASVIRIQLSGGDATAQIGVPITLAVTSGGSTSESTEIANSNNALLEYSVSNLSSVTQIVMTVDGTVREGIDMEVDLIDPAGDFEPPACIDKSFSGVGNENPLPEGSTFDTSISINTRGASSVEIKDSMVGLELGSAITLPSGCTTSASEGDSSFTISCDTSPDTALNFSYTSRLSAELSDGTVRNSVDSVCGTFGGSETSCGSTTGCTDTVSRTPPPPIPGITMYGLIAALLGLPMIGGLLIGRRRRKA